MASVSELLLPDSDQIRRGISYNWGAGDCSEACLVLPLALTVCSLPLLTIFLPGAVQKGGIGRPRGVGGGEGGSDKRTSNTPHGCSVGDGISKSGGGRRAKTVR